MSRRLDPRPLARRLTRRETLTRRTIERYLHVGGGSLAGGLAYAMLFSLFTILLAVAALAGVLLVDPLRRESAVATLSTLLPPLAPYVSSALSGLASGAVGLSIGSIVGLILGGVRLYLSLEGSLAQVFHESPRRSPWATARRAIAVPPLLALSFSALLVLIEPLARGADTLVAPLFSLVSIVAPLVLTGAALLLIYRLAPASPPSRRSSLRVSFVVALVLALVGRLWSTLTPLLLGNVALYGPPLAVILGLVYLQLVASAILLGGAALAEIAADERRVGDRSR
jgi:uncharacterized BrkB/YihY/UPF0761 family membrane protein